MRCSSRVPKCASRSPTWRDTAGLDNVTQLAMDVVDWFANAPSAAKAAQRLRKNWPPVVAFAVGALGGGFGDTLVGFYALVLPAAALGVALRKLRG